MLQNITIRRLSGANMCYQGHVRPQRCACTRTLTSLPFLQVNKLEITADKQYIAAAGNPHIKLFEVNANDPQPVSSYDGHTGNVTAVGFQKDSKWMFTGATRHCHITPRSIPLAGPGHAAHVGNLLPQLRPACSRLRPAATGGEDGMVKVWDLRAPGCQREYGSRAAVNTVVLHPNQGELISGEPRSAALSACCTAERQAVCRCCLLPVAAYAAHTWQPWPLCSTTSSHTCRHNTTAPQLQPPPHVHQHAATCCHQKQSGTAPLCRSLQVTRQATSACGTSQQAPAAASWSQR